MSTDTIYKVVKKGTMKFKMFNRVIRILIIIKHIIELQKNLIFLRALYALGYGYQSRDGKLKVAKREILVIMKNEKNEFTLICGHDRNQVMHVCYKRQFLESNWHKCTTVRQIRPTTYKKLQTKLQ